MEGGRVKEERWKQAAQALKKYKYAAAVILLGTLLMLLPSGEKAPADSDPPEDTERFDRAAVQREMEEILSAIEGVGELKLMLTVDAGTKHELAQDISAERGTSEGLRETSETVIVGTGSGTRGVVVTQSLYPRYVGALVVCEGGGSASVRLAVTEALRALTGLPSDKISVQQGNP